MERRETPKIDTVREVFHEEDDRVPREEPSPTADDSADEEEPETP